MTGNSWFVDDFSKQIFETKYKGIRNSAEDFYSALAMATSFGDTDKFMQFYDLMWKKRFSPGGRILAYAGRPMAKVSLMNCTTHSIQDDSLPGINNTSYSIMSASSKGQGIGIDLSMLRPEGSPVNNASITSTGPISFMELFNSVGGVIGQQGRRAALLFSLDVSHPDIDRPDLLIDGIPYDFLNVKRIPGKVENANISVKITDAFMRAVNNDLMWELHYEGYSGMNPFRIAREVPARKLFLKLANGAWNSAEPGILYWDTSRRMSNSDLFGERWKIVGVNACSEQVLDQNGVCNLGSLDLSKYVVFPFTEHAAFAFDIFERDVMLAVEFLDSILTLELKRRNHISILQRESIENLRRVGLGVMGLADMLAMLGYSYGDHPDTLSMIRRVFKSMRDAAYQQSINMAKELGPAKVWESDTDYRESIVNQGFYDTLPKEIKNQIIKYGTRNVCLLSIAPTGSISNLFGVTSGVEPLFAHQYVRRTVMNGSAEFVDYVHPGVKISRELGLPDSIYPTAYQISPDAHLAVQATIQKYVDSSISKTLNFPKFATNQDIKDAYMNAWKLGIKGLSVYRDESRTVQTLYVREEESNKCPSCGGSLAHESGCTTCYSCGYAVCDL